MAEKNLENNKDNNVDPDIEKLKAVIHARKNNLYSHARDLLDSILKRRPQFEPARRELIQLYISTENYIEAENFLKKEIKRLPNESHFYHQLGLVYSKLGKVKEEIETLKQLNAIKYDLKLAQRLFELQKNSNDITGALETLNILKVSEGNSLTLDIAEAKLLYINEKYDESLAQVEKLLDQNDTSSELIEFWCTIVLQQFNDPQKILDRFESKIHDQDTSGDVLVTLSRALGKVDRAHDAIECLKRAIKQSGEAVKPPWWYDLALLQRQSGLSEESQKSLMNAIRLNPHNASYLRVYGVEETSHYGDEITQHLNYAHAQIENYTDQKKVELLFALAKSYEDVGELNTAFKHYERAGKIQAKILPHKHSSALGVLKNSRLGFKRQLYEEFKAERCQSDKPVFILGMPRSGTSLSEQILASHSDVYGAGELKLLHRMVDGISINKKPIQTSSGNGVVATYIPGVDLKNTQKLNFLERGQLYVKSIDKLLEQAKRTQAKKVIDKMPGNYYWTGLIPLILPNAKIIHTQRHPIDNCLSLYRIYFPDGMPWSYDLVNLAKTYKACYEHMAHWETALPPGVMITMSYEIMVADFENQAKRLIDHVGLTWDEACLKFYETERSVKTASLSQVRKPIYNSSVGRWKKYESYLKPLILELGPLVEEYDAKIEKKLKELNK